ncbi:MAG: outer membrane beta-barrel protein [Planctomycetota bacterium]
MRVLGALLFSLAFLAFLPASQDTEASGELERADRLAELARDLVERGEGYQALALVQSELAELEGAKARSYALFTLGWLEHQLAGQDAAERVPHLERSAGHYREGLALAPTQTAAQANLALVEGDLAAEREDLTGAIQSWWRALDVHLEDDTAGRRILASLEGDADALAEEAQAFEVRGRPALARDAWERALAAASEDEAAEPLLRWLLLETELDAFGPESVERLDASCAAVDELRELVIDPDQAPIPSWATSPLEHHAIASALRALGTRRSFAGDGAGALDLYTRAVEIAPDPPVMGRPPVRLHAMLDMATRLHAHTQLDPSGQLLSELKTGLLDASSGSLIGDLEGRQRYYAVVGQILAERDQWTTPAPNNAAHLLRLAIALQEEIDGTTLQDTHPLPHLSELLAGGLLRSSDPMGSMEAYMDASHGYMDQEAWDPAERALRSAKGLAASLGGSERMNALETRFREATGRTVIELDRPIEASAPLLQQEPTPAAPNGSEPTQDPLPVAARPSEGSTDGLLLRLFTFDGDRIAGPVTVSSWGDSAWYAGGGFGPVWLRNSEGDVEGDLSAFGVGADLDRNHTGFKVYGGYRFEWPLAFELGYTDLGQIDSQVGPEPPGGGAALLDAIGDRHPATGRGPTAALRLLLFGTDSFAASARVGVWYWEADLDVQTSSATATIDRDGTDLFYGVDVAWHAVDWGAVRVDYERYVLDDTDADLLTFGVELDVDRLLGGGR